MRLWSILWYKMLIYLFLAFECFLRVECWLHGCNKLKTKWTYILKHLVPKLIKISYILKKSKYKYFSSLVKWKQFIESIKNLNLKKYSYFNFSWKIFVSIFFDVNGILNRNFFRIFFTDDNDRERNSHKVYVHIHTMLYVDSHLKLPSKVNFR